MTIGGQGSWVASLTHHGASLCHLVGGNFFQSHNSMLMSCGQKHLKCCDIFADPFVKVYLKKILIFHD